MLEVKNIRVLSLSVDFNQITWDVGDTTEDVFDYTFQLLRSEAAAGPWDVVTPEMEDQYIFVDNTIKNANIYRQYHYIIRVKHKASEQSRDFGPSMKAPEPDLVAVELRKHLNLLFREFAGRRCWLLPARTMGQRCSDCWNDRLKKRTRSGCRTCYDTSYVRGYHRPIEVWVQFDPSPAGEQPSNVGKLQQTSTTARMAHFPPVKPDDLLIEPENNRWKVRSRSTTQQGRAPVTQELQLHEVPTSDIEYAIPLDLGMAIENMYFNPSRNYTNPHTLADTEEVDFPGIYQMYPNQYPPIKQ